MERLNYDSDWIVAFAMALDAKAKTLVRNAYILSFVITLIAGALLFNSQQSLPVLGVGCVVAFFVSQSILVSRAHSQAALLQLQAHQALCQVQIEINTRK